MKHYLVTQWNCDLYDLDWLKQRQKLFETFTIPSVLAQTNKDFTWLLVSDSRTPKEFRSVLDSYPAEVIYHNFEGHKWPEVEGSDPIHRRSVQLEYISNVVSDYIGYQNTDYIITSRCDNDDAIAKDHMEKIRDGALEAWLTQPKPKFWLNIVRGYKWDRGIVYPKNSNRSPFISFVEPDNGHLLTTYQCCHTLATESEYNVVQVRQGAPTWMQVIHPDNLLNKTMRFRRPQPEDSIRDRFVFGDTKALNLNE